MKFINRQKELSELKEIENLSKKKLFVAAIYGLRRVGKTRLILEFLKGRGLYLFVNRNKTSPDLLDEFQQMLRTSKVLGELETIGSWDKFFEVLIERNVSPVVFDEFQNFAHVEPAVFGIMQKTVDLNEGKPGLFILSGSLIGLMKNLFQDSKEALYGRVKQGKKLEPLALESCLEIGKELKLEKEHLLELYFIFGGYPKYYVAIEDFGLEGKSSSESLERLLMAKDAPLEDEANSILSQEFGARSGIYYSILEAIASGNNTISAIAGSMNASPTSLTRQLKELKDHFEMIELEAPFSGTRGAYRIKHPLIDFWFSNIYRNFSDYAARKPEFLGRLKSNLNSVYGRRFEITAREFLISNLGLEDAKRQWGKIQGAEKGKNTYEIDVIGKKGQEIFAFECKWRELGYADAKKELAILRDKLRYVPGMAAIAKLGIVAKRIIGKQKLRSEGYLAYDVDDF